MTKEDVFFSLVRSGLWGSKLKGGELSHQAYTAIMSMAERQTVTGLVCHALIDNNIKLVKLDAIKTCSVQLEVAALNDKVSQELTALATLLHQHDVRFVVVKGQTLSVKYANQRSRMPGDIDFYCDADNFDKARDVITRAWQVEMDFSELKENDHVAFEHHGVIFEMHNTLSRFFSHKHKKYFDRWLVDTPVDMIHIGGTAVPVLEPTLNLVYTFNHLWGHLIELGVGMRQFCDIAVLVQEWSRSPLEQQSDGKLLAERLDKLGLLRVFKAVEVILVDKLGVDTPCLPVSISEKDRKYQKMILDIVFKRGNFGKYGRKNAVRSGWEYYIETLGLKLRHYGRFFWLSPRENLAALFKSIPQKIFRSFVR